MKNIIFIAPPTAGKGTQSALVSAKYGIPHISMGQLLRDEVMSNSENGNLIKEDIKLGRLIDEKISGEILLKRLLISDCEKGYILDGFPRSASQIPYLEEIIAKTNHQITHVFLIDIDKELAKKRTLGRLICSSCGANYNILFTDSTPNIKNKCDKCAGTLVKREDDNLEVFETRYKIYTDEAEKIISYFQNKNILHKIDGSISVDYTFSKINEVLEN